MAGKSRSWTSTITRVVPSRGRVMECVPGMRGLLGEGSEAAVEAAILHGLGHVLHAYPLTSREIRDSASDLEDAVVAAGGVQKRRTWRPLMRAFTRAPEPARRSL